MNRTRGRAQPPAPEISSSPADKPMQIEKIVNKHDILKRVHQNYELLYNKYAHLFDFAPTGFMVIDHSDVIIEINLSASLSLNAPRSKLIGRFITDFIHLEDRDSFKEYKLNSQKGLNPVFFELKMKKETMYGRLNKCVLNYSQLKSFGTPHVALIGEVPAIVMSLFGTASDLEAVKKSGDLKFEGKEEMWSQFKSCLDTYNFWFNIVEP